MTKLEKLKKAGQSPWLDFISKRIIDDGSLKKLIEQGLSGLTSNPSIFDNAISKTDDYDDEIRRLSQSGASAFEIYDELTVTDIQKAADLFMETYEKTNGSDGYVSLEINPKLAKNLEETIKEGKRIHAKVNRPNLMLKVPATEECFAAIREFTACGINVNATLIFSLEQYEKTALSYIQGIKEAKEKGLDVAKIYSVASVFISRIDVAVDKLLSDDDDLRGTAAIANAALIYNRFKELFKSFKGNIQRPLWASTSVKNPDYRDVKYIEELIAKNTVNTIPLNALEAFVDHGEIMPMRYTYSQAMDVFRKFEDMEINIDKICGKLLEDGIVLFEKAFESLMKSIDDKAAALKDKVIAIGSDHAGFQLKSFIAGFLMSLGYKINDLGAYSQDISVDYPDLGEAVAKEVASARACRGIVVCGSGIGISIAANKVRGIRAALVSDVEAAVLSRKHNNANVLALAGRPYNPERAAEAEKIIKAWLSTDFDGGRHQQRLDKISAIEQRQLLGL